MKGAWRHLLMCVTAVLSLAACDVHEWPDMPESEALCLRLNYATEMTEWGQLYHNYKLEDMGMGDTYDNMLNYGKMRYIVRAYPVANRQRAVQSHTHEFTFTRDVKYGYDNEVIIELPAGEYNIMVWGDMVAYPDDSYFYNADNFAEIMLQGDHRGATDHRDAFRGTGQVSLQTTIVSHEPQVLDITMQRPLAKYEFVATDLKEFIAKEYEYLEKEAATRGETSTVRVNTDDYRVVFYYPGYMPCAYNMYTDKRVDSKLNVLFESKLRVLNENEASLGFDYVFVDPAVQAVTVQVGLYDKDNRQLAMSEPINVPLQRDCHTILQGSFLMQQASGGIAIDPEFDGDHTIMIE